MPHADTIPSVNQTGGTPKLRPPPRLWPGVVLVALMGLFRFVAPIVTPDAGPVALMGALGCALLIFLWWLFFSRVPWLERIAALVLVPTALIATRSVVHPSIAGGAMGYLLFLYAIPVIAFALVAAAVATHRFSTTVRRAAIAAAIVIASGVFAALRTGGLSSDGSDFHWRWTQTPEERLLAQAHDQPKTTSPAPREPGKPAAPANDIASWPGFRGPNRDGIVRGTRIETNWSASPPVEAWRRPIGPGWSSFAVD
jgi:outer membrane protein assembly factor BamB